MGGENRGYLGQLARLRCLREGSSSLQSFGSDASSPGSAEVVASLGFVKASSGRVTIQHFSLEHRIKGTGCTSTRLILEWRASSSYTGLLYVIGCHTGTS
jgi:hypothetical protein